LSAGPIDGAIGKPSVDDEPAIPCSVTELVGGGMVFISILDHRLLVAIAH
jgi:hypothetical protein